MTMRSTSSTSPRREIRPGATDFRVGRGVQHDAGLGEQPGDLARGVGTEERQRRGSGVTTCSSSEAHISYARSASISASS